MRLATLQDPQTRTPVPSVEVTGGNWLPIRQIPVAAESGIAVQSADLAALLPHIDSLGRLMRETASARRDREFLVPDPGAGPRFLPPVPRPATFRDFYAFEQHVATCRAKRGLPVDPNWYQQPVFYFSNPLSLVGHEHPVYAPAGSEQLDFELELGLVIGRTGRDISQDEAWGYVAGFTIVNDFSARDLQRREMSVGLGPAKGKDFVTAVGPCLVTLDELSDRIDCSGRIDLEMVARINGRTISRGNARDMYFSWPQIIEHAARDAMLVPGDLIASGTVGTGCILELGPEVTGGWLKAGDVVELEIERIGILRNRIVPRPSSSQTSGKVSTREEPPCLCT